ncbi:MAG TPA: O-antigen ligase family protein [Bryobacteraceae bacterium]|nr:O-antigen ligase family protein [Bryobacteraceae bacterium]
MSLTDRPDLLGALGLIVYCAYALSGYLNDWSLHYFGGKAYLSIAALVLLPVVWLLCDGRFRGSRNPIGRWWIAFLACLLIATPFSYWRMGSLTMLSNYIPRCYLGFFFITAFITSVSRCRTLMYINIASSVCLLASCLKFGEYSDDGRLYIPESLFYRNANELALALLLGAVQFAFLVYGRGVIRKLVGAAGIFVCIALMLRTGSRGCLLAALAASALVFFVSRHRAVVAAIALLVILAGIMLAPSMALRRLSMLSFDFDVAKNDAEGSAIGSGIERSELFKRSLLETAKHPLLGIGPDQFAAKVWGDATKQGKWGAWLGTHNSYTQVSSECGIPALICYVAIIFWSLRLNYRLYRRTSNDPSLSDVSALSMCLLAGTLVYAVGTFFFHMAYTNSLPVLSGMTVSLTLATKPLFAEPEPGAGPGFQSANELNHNQA